MRLEKQVLTRAELEPREELLHDLGLHVQVPVGVEDLTGERFVFGFQYG